jgi:hypothetical protein
MRCSTQHIPISEPTIRPSPPAAEIPKTASVLTTGSTPSVAVVRSAAPATAVVAARRARTALRCLAP